MADNGGLIVVLALLLIFGGIITLNDEEATQATTQCNDGNDNDGDGKSDAISEGETLVDQECVFIVFDGANATNYECTSWDNEGVAPTSLEECGY